MEWGKNGGIVWVQPERYGLAEISTYGLWGQIPCIPTYDSEKVWVITEYGLYS